MAGSGLWADSRSYHLFRLGGRWHNRPYRHCREMWKRYGLHHRGKLWRCLQAEKLSCRKQRNLWLWYSCVLKKAKERPEGYSSGSFALHRLFAVASITDNSLSFKLSSCDSKRLRTELFSAFYLYIFVHRNIKHRDKLNKQFKAWMLPLVFNRLQMSGVVINNAGKVISGHPFCQSSLFDSLFT